MCGGDGAAKPEGAVGMRRWVLGGIGVSAVAAVVAGAGGRLVRERGLEAAWRAERQPAERARFDPSMVEGLPAPARRLLLRAIAPGTPLASSVELRMRGTIQLDREREPMAMRAEQLLRHGDGFAWRARVASGAMRIRGYDRLLGGTGEMRWWLYGVVPVVRADGDDYDRSAAGRLAAETIWLLPSALLPAAGAEWEPVDDSTARVRLPWTGETEPVEVTVDDDGRPTRVSIRRWNGDPANGPVGRLPFIADSMARERTFDGYSIPTTVRAGWRLDAPDAFPFFHAVIEEAVYR